MLSRATLGGIDQGVKQGTESCRERECEAKQPEERSVKRTRDEVSSGLTLDCFRSREPRSGRSPDAAERSPWRA